MTIDYDKLHQELQEMNEGVHATTRYTWLDLARELLRLRRELTDLRGLMRTHARYQRSDGYDTAADWTRDHADRLNRIIEGNQK